MKAPIGSDRLAQLLSGLELYELKTFVITKKPNEQPPQRNKNWYRPQENSGLAKLFNKGVQVWGAHCPTERCEGNPGKDVRECQQNDWECQQKFFGARHSGFASQFSIIFTIPPISERFFWPWNPLGIFRIHIRQFRVDLA
jgi:hypothetical protein